jgi:hypothetical protein
VRESEGRNYSVFTDKVGDKISSRTKQRRRNQQQDDDDEDDDNNSYEYYLCMELFLNQQ